MIPVAAEESCRCPAGWISNGGTCMCCNHAHGFEWSPALLRHACLTCSEPEE